MFVLLAPLSSNPTVHDDAYSNQMRRHVCRGWLHVISTMAACVLVSFFGARMSLIPRAAVIE